MLPNSANDFRDKKICNAIKYAQRVLINTNFFQTSDQYFCNKSQTDALSRRSPRTARLSPKYNNTDYSAKEKILIEIIYRLGKELKKCKSKRKKVSFHPNAKEKNGDSLKSHSKKYRARTASASSTTRRTRSP
jgi:hypothetical protein